MSDIGVTTKPERQRKNIVIESSIARLANSVINLEDFISEVRQGNIPPQQEADKVAEAPSLMSTLNSAPEKINNITDRIHSAIDELRDALF